MKNEDLISFVKYILNKYSATPDEWDAFEDALYSLDATHKVSAVYYPKTKEVNATWEDIATGKSVDVTFRVTPDKGSDIAKIMMPCVYQKAICTKHK